MNRELVPLSPLCLCQTSHQTVQHVQWIVPVFVYILNRLGGLPEADVDKRRTIDLCNGKPTQPRHLTCIIECDGPRTRASFIAKDMVRAKLFSRCREATNWCKKNSFLPDFQRFTTRLQLIYEQPALSAIIRNAPRESSVSPRQAP